MSNHIEASVEEFDSVTLVRSKGRNSQINPFEISDDCKSLQLTNLFIDSAIIKSIADSNILELIIRQCAFETGCLKELSNTHLQELEIVGLEDLNFSDLKLPNLRNLTLKGDFDDPPTVKISNAAFPILDFLTIDGYDVGKVNLDIPLDGLYLTDCIGKIILNAKVCKIKEMFIDSPKLQLLSEYELESLSDLELSSNEQLATILPDCTSELEYLKVSSFEPCDLNITDKHELDELVLRSKSDAKLTFSSKKVPEKLKLICNGELTIDISTNLAGITEISANSGLTVIKPLNLSRTKRLQISAPEIKGKLFTEDDPQHLRALSIFTINGKIAIPPSWKARSLSDLIIVGQIANDTMLIDYPKLDTLTLRSTKLRNLVVQCSPMVIAISDPTLERISLHKDSELQLRLGGKSEPIIKRI